MSVALQNSIRELESANVVAKLHGQPSPDQLIIYTAHWDHMGIDPERTGDNIFNGAQDNASGTAGLLEIAQAFGRLDEAPARSILFLAVTAEEQGLPWLSTLRSQPALSAQGHGRGHQHGWPQPAGTDPGCNRRRNGAIDAGRPRDQTRFTTGPHLTTRPGARKRPLLSIRSLRVRESGNPCVLP